MLYNQYHETLELVRTNRMELISVPPAAWSYVEMRDGKVQLSDAGKDFIRQCEMSKPEYPLIYGALTDANSEIGILYRKYKDDPKAKDVWLLSLEAMTVAKTLESPEQLKQLCDEPMPITSLHSVMAARLLRYEMISKVYIKDVPHYAATRLGTLVAVLADYK